MDSLTHTIIAVSLMGLAYYVGNYLGTRRGMIDAWSVVMSATNAKEIIFEDDGKLTIVKSDNTTKTLGE